MSSNGRILGRPPLSEIGRRPARTGAESSKTWRQRNPEKYRDCMVRATAKIKATVVAAKDVPCADCGVRYPSYVMDFDHVRGEKKFCIGHSAFQQGMKAVLAEIEKCEVVCANCHRERTHGRKQQAA